MLIGSRRSTLSHSLSLAFVGRNGSAMTLEDVKMRDKVAHTSREDVQKNTHRILRQISLSILVGLGTTKTG